MTEHKAVEPMALPDILHNLIDYVRDNVLNDYDYNMEMLIDGAVKNIAATHTAENGGDISHFLKEGETALRRLERYRQDLINSLKELALERGKVEELQRENRQLEALLRLNK